MLKSKWDAIPDNTDILITHGPAFGYLDDVEGRRGQHLGCELLRDKVLEIKPKIHVCGHIESWVDFNLVGVFIITLANAKNKIFTTKAY